MMARRTLCSASAGTGKTHALCDEVARAVRDEDLDPARVLGVTFTNLAAAELKGRVQAHLLHDPDAKLDPRARVERAERLELAAIGTVHSVAYRILQRHAFRLGLAPRLQVLDEAGAERVLDEALLRMGEGPWWELVQAGRPLGIRDPKALARALLALQRTNRIPDAALVDQMHTGADRVCQLLAPGGPNPRAPTFEDLYGAARQTLVQLERIGDAGNDTRKAREKLRGILARQSGEWRDFAVCAGLEANKRDGGDAALASLRSLAVGVRGSAALHDDLRRYADLLARQTVALRQAYEEAKQARGLLDFADLEARFLDLLELEDVAADLRAAFGLVVVDEFQDTNPIQLAIFVRLHQIVGRSFWVGDPKQAIYGFRDADSELMEAVWRGQDVLGAREGAPDLLAQLWGEGSRDERMHLATSRRSQAGLVAFLNQVFEPVFGASARLEPLRPASEPAVERWRLAVSNLDDEAAAIAAGIAQLRAEGVALGDIAMLARTNDRARRLGGALKAQGIPALAPLPGLLAARECAVALAGLRLVLDRRDGLAAAEVLHLLSDASEPTPGWLEARLRERAKGDGGEPWAGHELLAPLRGLDARALPPVEALAAVIHALDLPGRIAAWGDPARRAANLDALLDLAAAVQTQALDEGRAATVPGLLVDLAKRARAGQDHFPLPRGLDAVTVLTYHGSKGLEWPIVVLTGLDAEVKPDPWRPRATGGLAAEGRPLERRAVQAWIWPFGGSDGPYPKRTGGSGLEDAALVSPEGQAIQAAEEEEAKRLLYVGMTRARDRLVLAHRVHPKKGADAYPWLAQFPVDRVLNPSGTAGRRELPGGAVAQVRDLDGQDAAPAAPAARSRWVLDPALPARPALARYRNPSEEPPAEGVALGAAESLGPRLPLGHVRDEAQYEALGIAVHAYLASLPSLEGCEQGVRVRVADRCLRRFGVEGLLAPLDLVAAGERLRAWVEKRYPGAVWYTEVPVTGPAPDGRQWSGVVDLLLVNPDGGAVVVDHKGATVPEALDAAKAGTFAAQVAAYRTVLEAQGLRVEAGFIHLPLGGGMLPVVPR